MTGDHLFADGQADARPGVLNPGMQPLEHLEDLVGVLGVNADPADSAVTTDWAKAYWEALHPFSAGGAYLNMIMDEGSERVRATYGSNYEQLTRIKAMYDPTNLFRSNQNIPPKRS